MSMLFPLFLAAAAAVLAPILLHLLRNRARTVQVFSSLMFLRPAPPRMQPKSRVEHLPLLLLRCLALLLLALAFARPWWPTSEFADAAHGGRTLVLLDTSASMARDGLWQQALAHLDLATDDPQQRLAVAVFDRGLRPLVGFEDWAARPAATRAEHVRNRARGQRPGHAGTDLGAALAGAIDLLSDDEAAAREVTGAKRIVLISDLQAGHGLEALRTVDWPDGLELAIREVASAKPGNAGLALVGAAPGLVPEADTRARVRVGNEAASTVQTFVLAWSDGVGAPLSVTVPPGGSRVVRAPARPEGRPGTALVLSGDDHPFDNTVYLADAAPTPVPVLYLGADAVDDPAGLSYFLAHALQPTTTMAPQLVAQAPDVAIQDLARFAWVVVGSAPAPAVARQLGAHVTAGGALTVVLRQAQDAAWLDQVCAAPLRAQEARLGGHALIGRVDFSQPLLRPFEAAQFGDFSRIHVWRHRTVTPPPAAQVLAWYDDGSPAWFELAVGKGRVLVLTSGWHPADSQLALSTKFVPLIHTELQRSSRIVARPAQVIIGDPATMPAGVLSVSGPLASTAAGTPAVDRAGDPSSPAVIERPGLYRLQTAGGGMLLAANLDPLESHTAPLARETLEAIGVTVATGAASSAVESAARERQVQRQLKVAEIESRQKSWLWILVGAFAVLLVETIAASIATTARPAGIPAATVPAGATP